MKIIPYGRQHITEEDISSVVDVLRSDYLTQGPVVRQFEEAFADYTGARYAVAVANGTGALHLSMMTLGVNEADKVITTPITFAATANAVGYCGGEVVFVDIDPDTRVLDIDKARERLKASGDGIKGIVPVDFAGLAVDMEAFRSLADEFGLWIIEDACHAPGGYFTDSSGRKQMCGNGRFADLSVFSFHPVKHITAGEGGMVTTNSEDLYRKLVKQRAHGITRDSGEFRNSIEFAMGIDKGEESSPVPEDYPGWYMEMQEPGYNYRLTEFQSALGMSQLSGADAGIVRRRELAARYNAFFHGLPFVRKEAGMVDGHAFHLYVVEVEDRFGLYNFLKERGIYTQVHYIPLHLMPYYRQYGWKEGDLPVAEEYYRGCLSLPLFPTLTNEEQDFVIKSVETFYS